MAGASPSLSGTAAAAFLAASYARTIRYWQPARATRYACWGLAQTRYALGDAGRSLVVGVGKDPPTAAANQAASCPDPPAACDAVTARLTPTPNPHVLYGALVEGPGWSDRYVDARPLNGSRVTPVSIVALGVKRPKVAPARAGKGHVAAGAVGVALGLAGLIVLAGGAMSLALEAKTVSFTLYDIILQGGAVLFGAAALAPAHRVGGWRTHLAAVGLASCATVNILRTALPPYLDGATGAVRAGAATASVGNLIAMLALGIVPAADSKATPGVKYGGAPIGALAYGSLGQLASVAGVASAIVGAALGTVRNVTGRLSGKSGASASPVRAFRIPVSSGIPASAPSV